MSRRGVLATGALATAAGITAGLAVAGQATAAAAGLAPAGQATAAAAGGTRAGQPASTPATAIARLLAGNRRFCEGRTRHPDQSLGRLHEIASGQHPFAINVACADSRVAPEILFDEGLGDIFDVRAAGNTVDDLLLGSIEYAVEEFSPAVLVVLGHERCGAVTATVENIRNGGTLPGHIGCVVDALRPIVAPVVGQPGDAVENGMLANVRTQVRLLSARSEIIRGRVEAGTMALIGARYDLDTGVVELVR